MSTDLAVCHAFVEMHPADAARVLERLAVADVAALFAQTPAASAAVVVAQMTPAAASDCLTAMEPSGAAAIVDRLPTDAAADLLRRMADANRTDLLSRLSPAEAAALRSVLAYPPDCAGAFMDPRAQAVPDDVTVADALARIRRAPHHLLYYVYVIDRSRRLAGVLDLRELMLARPGQVLADTMRRPVASVPASATRAALVAHPGWRDFHALPVVDRDSTFVGAIRYQTLRALEDAAGQRAGARDAMAAAFALGELYWLGLTGVLEGVASAIGQGIGRRTEVDDDTL
jgi:magnesium transporter